MQTTVIDLDTGGNRAAIDVTAEAAAFVVGKGDGLLHAFVPHATAGVAVFETGAGSDDDVMDHLDALFPRDER